VPLAGDHGDECGPIMFDRWLPLAEQDSIVATIDGLSVRIWLDASCIAQRPPLAVENIERARQIYVSKLCVEVGGLEVTDRLGHLTVTLASENDWTAEHISATYDADLLDEYSILGRRAYASAIAAVNRLLSYVRARKGQYWLNEYRPDKGTHSEFTRLRAMAKIADSDWVRLSIPGAFEYRAISIPEHERIIQKKDWQEITSHVATFKRPPLAGLLLAGAEELLRAGHSRAALIEAVSALEVAINRFADNADPERWEEHVRGRASSQSLKAHVHDLGLRGTVNYLLPVLYTNEQLGGEVLESCRSAIRDRNDVVHNGRQRLDPQLLGTQLRSIRSLCDQLERLQLGTVD